MNDHLISNEVVVVVVVQASGESIIFDQLHLCSICGPAKEKNWMNQSQNMKWFGSTKWFGVQQFFFPYDG
jgi:hypothetical protein